jgi:hypothetical protein
MQFPLHFSDEFDDSLACPICGFGYVHINQVMVAARREDERPTSILVDAVTGYVARGSHTAVPAGPTVGEGRRHRIALLGSCEEGHEFAIVFTQHKGNTFVEVLAPEWRAL